MKSIDHLKEVMFSYHEITNECWNEFKLIVREKKVNKGTVLIHLGDIPNSFFFIHKGLVRIYTISNNESAREVNKNFFEEGRFPASVVASLDQKPSNICVETIEQSTIVEIDHSKYRLLLDKYEDLKWYHIKYLEKHWVKEKESIETSLLEGEGKKRYLDFIRDNPVLAKRVPLYHLASRLGITPTQLSRIRKNINL